MKMIDLLYHKAAYAGVLEASRRNFVEIMEIVFCDWLDPTYVAMWHRKSISKYSHMLSLRVKIKLLRLCHRIRD